MRGHCSLILKKRFHYRTLLRFLCFQKLEDTTTTSSTPTDGAEVPIVVDEDPNSSSSIDDIFSTADSLDRFRRAKQLFTELESKCSGSKASNAKRPLLKASNAPIEDDTGDQETQSDFLTQTAQMTTRSLKRVRFSDRPVVVFTTFSSEEYDRTNDTIDPMAASAEYELEKRVERLNTYEVTLTKEEELSSLGFTIIGMGVGADLGIERLGMFIKSIADGGPAALDGRIEVGDQIIEVNEKNLVGVTQGYAAQVLKQAVTCRFSTSIASPSFFGHLSV
ncbi:hypothetical protein ACOME3_001792 [Neoechinorhynchus agilis]